MLIDVAISGERNVIKKESEKILKYKDLIIEIQCMWNVKSKVIPAIRGATGTISKSLTQYLSNIPGSTEFRDYKNTAILVTTHIPRNELNTCSVKWRGEFRPRQTRQLPRAVDLKGRLLSCQSY